MANGGLVNEWKTGLFSRSCECRIDEWRFFRGRVNAEWVNGSSANGPKIPVNGLN